MNDDFVTFGHGLIILLCFDINFYCPFYFPDIMSPVLVYWSVASSYGDVIIVMMTSWNGNIFRVTGPLCGELTGPRWIPVTKARDAELLCFLWYLPWINGWVNNREAGNLRWYRAHYDVTVMYHVETYIWEKQAFSPRWLQHALQPWRSIIKSSHCERVAAQLRSIEHKCHLTNVLSSNIHKGIFKLESVYSLST